MSPLTPIPNCGSTAIHEKSKDGRFSSLWHLVVIIETTILSECNYSRGAPLLPGHDEMWGIGSLIFVSLASRSRFRNNLWFQYQIPVPSVSNNFTRPICRLNCKECDEKKSNERMRKHEKQTALQMGQLRRHFLLKSSKSKLITSAAMDSPGMLSRCRYENRIVKRGEQRDKLRQHWHKAIRSLAKSMDRRDTGDNLDHYGAATLRCLFTPAIGYNAFSHNYYFHSRISALNSSASENESEQHCVEIPLEEIWKPQKDTKLELDYRMGRAKKGKAIIFNHFEFSMPGMLQRRGTNLDQDMFYQILLIWGFKESDIVIELDASFERITDLSKRVNHDDCDMFVCAVFTHGERNQLYSKDKLYPTSDVWKCFTDEECPSLKGKPKLFFIQACRGTDLDAGIEVKDPKLLLEKFTRLNIDANDGDGDGDGDTPDPEQVLVITSNDKSLLDAIDNLDEVDSKPIDLAGPPRSRGGSIQGIPSSWQEERRSSADETIPYVKDKSFWFPPKRRSRGTSEGEKDALLLTTLQMDRRSSAPIKVPREWLEKQNEVMDSKFIELKEPFQVPHPDPDIFVAFSTADGFYSFRRPTHGSWFIHVLHEVVRVNRHLDEANLLDLLTAVNLKVAVDMESYVTDPGKRAYHKQKQISCFHSTLTKRVYFTKY
uniref:Caspase family p20 domain-containing protein n=1 Tax=Strigamia maritima TaxID=126957 RepID=T1IXK5_STRMM